MHTKNFCDYEFVCRCGKCVHSVPHAGIVDQKLLIALQLVRDRFKQPIIVTSGRRCKKRNAAVGGVYNSYHLTGQAADVKADDMKKLFEALCSVKSLHYIEPHDTYIHVDIGHERKKRINDKRNGTQKV